MRPFTKGFIKLSCGVKQHRNLIKFEIEGDHPSLVYEVIYKFEVLVVYPFDGYLSLYFLLVQHNNKITIWKIDRTKLSYRYIRQSEAFHKTYTLLANML